MAWLVPEQTGTLPEPGTKGLWPHPANGGPFPAAVTIVGAWPTPVTHLPGGMVPQMPVAVTALFTAQAMFVASLVPGLPVVAFIDAEGSVTWHVVPIGTADLDAQAGAVFTVAAVVGTPADVLAEAVFAAATAAGVGAPASVEATLSAGVIAGYVRAADATAEAVFTAVYTPIGTAVAGASVEASLSARWPSQRMPRWRRRSRLGLSHHCLPMPRWRRRLRLGWWRLCLSLPMRRWWARSLLGRLCLSLPMSLPRARCRCLWRLCSQGRLRRRWRPL